MESSSGETISMMIVKLQQHFPLRVTDWLLGGILTSWGLGVLYVPAETWELSIYSGLRAFASQHVWGSVAVILGFVRMTALFINGAVRRTPHIRGFCAFLSVVLWLQLALSMFQSEITTLAVVIYPWLFFADIYNVYRASQDARDSDETFAAQHKGANRDALSAQH